MARKLNHPNRTLKQLLEDMENALDDRLVFRKSDLEDAMTHLYNYEDLLEKNKKLA